MQPSTLSKVPDHYRGVWVRNLLETPTQRDTTTFVRWMQTSQWHADVRVPAAARTPGVPASATTLAQRVSQQGFSGVTEVTHDGTNEICTWHRRYDFLPPRPDADTGTMVFETPHRVIERGIHSEYLEVWERLPESMGACIALAGRTITGADNGERLFLTGKCVMRVQPWAECEISFGHLVDGVWRVERSLVPELEGLAIPLVMTRLDLDTAEVHIGNQLSAWSVLEWSDAP
jgi:hypothetical protein